ncbi:MAG TPA: ABC transporter permease subunit [Candidatus Melainabacteria bacterium]|nr:ABC transporter permease subunit [Candidatus Melainabacteria bacterium]
MTELKATLAIALNTFRESVRDRVLYAFFIFACLITMLGIVLGSLSIGQEIRIIEDLGLSVIAIIGGIITVFTGTTLVYKELDKRTIYVIFSKPVTSWQFILGKYLGLAACIILVTAAMGLFLVALIWMVDPLHQIQLHLPWLCGALGLVLLELLFVLAIATFFSTFSTPIMSVIFTLSIWFIGHLGSSLLELSNMSQSQMAKMILSGIYWILPDLAGLTRIRLELTYMQPPSQEILNYLVSYIVAYVVLLLGAAAVVNEKREFP